MKEYPVDLMEFEKEFSTEEQRRAYLYGLRWPNGFVCPYCGGEKAWQTGEACFSIGSSKMLSS